LSILSKFVRKAAPIVATVAPFVGGAGVAVGAAAGAIATNEARRKQQAQEREITGMELFGNQTISRGAVQVPPYVSPTTTQSAGFGSGIGGFFERVGTGTMGLLENVLPGVITGKILGQPVQRANMGVATTTTGNLGAQESQGSGAVQAGMGTILGPALNVGRSILKSPFGQIGTGLGAIGLGSLMTADGRQMRVTRKMKAQARMLLNMTGGNLQATADMLGIDTQTLVFILLKRFRNDGPVVTKAALRKTKSTIRKLKGMCDMYDDLRPAARRRTTTRRKMAGTTLISNK
jgi:hypothetical protein